MAAITPNVKIMGIFDWKIENIGVPIYESLISFCISYGVICRACEKNMAKNMAAAINNRYNTQQKQSVQFRYSMGPFLHWAGVL